MNRLTSTLKLNQRVRILDSDDPPIDGVITSREQFRDGTERWNVLYWHQGEPKRMQCEACELEAAE